MYFTLTARRKDPNASEIKVEKEREEEQPEEVGAEEVGFIGVRVLSLLFIVCAPLPLVLIFILL